MKGEVKRFFEKRKDQVVRRALLEQRGEVLKASGYPDVALHPIEREGQYVSERNRSLVHRVSLAEEDRQYVPFAERKSENTTSMEESRERTFRVGDSVYAQSFYVVRPGGYVVPYYESTVVETEGPFKGERYKHSFRGKDEIALAERLERDERR